MHMPPGLSPYFRAIAALGFGAMIIDTLMSAAFGLTIGYVPMVGLAIISLASGLFLVAAEFFRRIGWTQISKVAVGVWAIAFVFNIWSNMGVATSTRMGEVQQATVQQTTYKEAEKATDEAKARLALFTAQLEDLTKANAWAATVSASGLRSQVDALKSAEVAEARLGGCGRKCRAIQNQIVEVQGKIAVAEQRDDLTGRIEATKAVLAKARTQLAGTNAGISATANQSTLYAKLISFNLADDPEAAMVTVANESTGIAMALVIAVVSAFLTLVGALPHLVGASPDSIGPAQKPIKTPSAPENGSGVNEQLEALKAQLHGLVGNNATQSLNLRVMHEPLRDRIGRLAAA